MVVTLVIVIFYPFRLNKNSNFTKIVLSNKRTVTCNLVYELQITHGHYTVIVMRFDPQWSDVGHLVSTGQRTKTYILD